MSSGHLFAAALSFIRIFRAVTEPLRVDTAFDNVFPPCGHWSGAEHRDCPLNSCLGEVLGVAHSKAGQRKRLIACNGFLQDVRMGYTFIFCCPFLSSSKSWKCVPAFGVFMRCVLGSRKRRTEDSIPMDAAGEKILTFKSWGTDTFWVQIHVYYTPWRYWLLVEWLKTLEVDVPMLSWGWLKKLPYWFGSVCSGRIIYIHSCPDFCWVCEKGVNPETCIFNMVFWLCWQLVLCCPCGQTQALVPHWINWSWFSVAVCVPLVQAWWCQLDKTAVSGSYDPSKNKQKKPQTHEKTPNQQEPRILPKRWVSFAKNSYSMSISPVVCSLKNHPVLIAFTPWKKNSHCPFNFKKGKSKLFASKLSTLIAIHMGQFVNIRLRS